MIRLEPIALTHADALQPLLEQVAATATTPFPWPYPPDGATVYISELLARREAGDRYAFVIREQDGLPLGVSVLKGLDRESGEAELGYWIGVPYWGRGLATSAAAATLNFGFDTLGLQVIRAVCLADNAASLRVLAKLGFTETGRFPQSLPRGSEPRPCVLLRLPREAWRQPHTASVAP